MVTEFLDAVAFTFDASGGMGEVFIFFSVLYELEPSALFERIL